MRLLASLAAFVALALVACISLRLGYADHLSHTGDPDALRRARQLAPGKATYLTDGVDSGDPGVLRKALALNPYYARGWIELGLQAELAGDNAEAERLLLQAAKVDRTYEPRWALANFYYRRGDREALWRWSRNAAEIAYLDQTALFDLCWRMSPGPAEILDKAIPQQPRVLAQYLSFLVNRKHLEAARPVAGLLTSKGGPALAPLMLFYCDRLLQNGQAAEAVELWNTLCARHIIKSQPLRPETGESLSNGDFFTAPLAAGFDWRPVRTGGATATVLQSPPELSVTFNGEEPEACRVFEQVMPLVPARKYRLRYSFRTSGIASGSGLRWEIVPLSPWQGGWAPPAQRPCSITSGNTVNRVLPERGGERCLAGSPDLWSEDWTQGEFSFATPDSIGAARLSLSYRRASGTTRIEGSIHLRAVSLSLEP